MDVLLGIFGTSFASALFPLINVEAVLVVAKSQSEQTVWALVLAAAIGQMLGKILWYWGGMHVDRAPWVSKHLAKPKPAASLAKWQERAEGRPWFTAGLLFISAWAGFPPYAVMAVLAGVIRVPFWIFFTTGFLGRGLRFWTVVGGAQIIMGWF